MSKCRQMHLSIPAKNGRLPAIRLRRWVARMVVMDSRPFQDLPDIVGSFDDPRITIYANKVKQGPGHVAGLASP